MEDLGNILPRVLKKHVRGESAPVLAVLAGVWPRVAGKAMAEQSRPVSFSAGTLTLAVTCPNWAVQLKGLSEVIRKAANEALGRPAVRQVRIKLADLNEDAGRKPAAKPEHGRQLAADSVEADIPALAKLAPELREIVARSFAKYFAHSDRKVN